MESVVHQPLGDVHGLHPGRLLERAHVQDELVGDEALVPRVQRGVVVAKAVAHVVGVEDGHLGGAEETLGAHHLLKKKPLNDIPV